jgi:hypothetical protein
MMRREAWSKLVRDDRIGRLIQLAAASGVAVFQEAGAPATTTAMRWLLEAAILADRGLACGSLPVFEKEAKG